MAKQILLLVYLRQMWPDITRRYRRHFKLAFIFQCPTNDVKSPIVTYTSTQLFVLTDRHYLDNSVIAILPKAPEEEDEERASERRRPRVRKGQGKAEKS